MSPARNDSPPRGHGMPAEDAGTEGDETHVKGPGRFARASDDYARVAKGCSLAV